MSAPFGSTIMHVALAGALMAQIDMRAPDVHVPLCDGECMRPGIDFDDDAQYKTEHVYGELVAAPALAVARTLTARISAYTATGNRTRSGTWPSFGTVAVDPSVIPLGSRLVIEGFPGVTFTALDTGGGVRGAHVDVYMSSYADAIRWGVQQRRVTVLR